MGKIIYAGEAKRIADDVSMRAHEKELSDIMEKIKDASNKGRHEIYENGRLDQQIVNILKKLGYKYTVSFYMNECSYRLEWM